MARCAVCLGEFQNGEPGPLFKDEYIVHRACASGTPLIRSELASSRAARDALLRQLEQAQKSARAVMDRAHEIEARVFNENASVHARVTELEQALAAERSLRTTLEAELDLLRRRAAVANSAPAPQEEITTPEPQDDFVVRSSLLELD